jgi:hypothetical protein
MKVISQTPGVTRVPMKLKMRGGNTVMVLPDGTRVVERREATLDNAMVKVIARAFRWQRLLQDGAFCSIGELARSEKINPSYVSRVLRLAFLSPAVIEKILEGKQPAHLTLTDLMTPFPADWTLQERIFLGRVGTDSPGQLEGNGS